MTEDKPDRYKEFIKLTNEEMVLGELLKNGESRIPSKIGPAKEEIKKKAYEIALDKNPQFVSDRRITDASEMPLDYSQDIVKTAYNTANYDSNDRFNKGIEGILEDAPNEVLEKLVLIKHVREAAEGDNAEVMEAYLAIEELKDFERRYNAGEKIKREEAEKLTNHVKRGVEAEMDKRYKAAKKAEADRQKKQGYNIETLQDAWGSLAANGFKLGLAETDDEKMEKQKAYALEGVRKEIEEHTKAYEELAKQKGDIYKAVRTTVKEIAKGEDEEAFMNTRSALYSLGK